MGAPAKTTGRKATGRKAATAVAAHPRAIAAPPPVAGPIVVPTDGVPEELRDFYAPGPPKLSRPRGAGTTGGDISLDFTSPTREEIAEVPLEKLFSIDGYDFHIPVEFPPSVGILYLDGVGDSRDVALGRVLKTAIGEQGWGALVAFAAKGGMISKAQFGALMDRVLTKVLGAIDEGNG